MSSPICDPIWPIVHYFEGIAAAAVRHVWCGIVGMDAGDWAGWAQAFGAMAAIIFAFHKGRQDTELRNQERAKIEAEDINNRVINYEIGVDIFKSLAAEADLFLSLVKAGHLNVIRRSEPLDSMNSALAILDRIMIDRLPSTYAAIDIQTMRLMGLNIRSECRVILARKESKPDIPQGMFDNVAEAIDLANIDRTSDGPKDMAEFQRRFGDWRLAPIKD